MPNGRPVWEMHIAYARTYTAAERTPSSSVAVSVVLSVLMKLARMMLNTGNAHPFTAADSTPATRYALSARVA